MPERSPDNHSQANAEIHADRLCIHDTALIATSAQLQTSAPYRIEIGAGVVIGEGCWLQACSGDIIIESGTVLGVGVLIVGWSKIGALSIIGSAVTLFEAAIDSGVTISAHSVHGLPERDIPLTCPVADTPQEVDNLADPWDDPEPSSVNRHNSTIEEETSSADPIPETPPATSPAPQPNSGLKIPFTSSPFIRSWKRPTVDPVVNTASQADELTDRPMNFSPVDPTPPKIDSVIDSVVDGAINGKQKSANDIPPSHSEIANPAKQDAAPLDSGKNDDRPVDEPHNNDSANDSATEEIIEEITITHSISQSQNVYGRQHVNRIIDSILRRNTPET